MPHSEHIFNIGYPELSMMSCKKQHVNLTTVFMTWENFSVVVMPCFGVVGKFVKKQNNFTSNKILISCEVSLTWLRMYFSMPVSFFPSELLSVGRLFIDGVRRHDLSEHWMSEKISNFCVINKGSASGCTVRGPFISWILFKTPWWKEKSYKDPW